jgi:hypothetical protein
MMGGSAFANHGSDELRYELLRPALPGDFAPAMIAGLETRRIGRGS